MTRGKRMLAQTVKLLFIMPAGVIYVLIRVVRRAHFGLSATHTYCHVESLQ